MNRDTRKLLEFDEVNYKRAKRLLKVFGDYESVMNATYDQLIEVHYIGPKTAESLYYHDTSEPGSLLDTE